MKRCPNCNRTYTDDALSFCLDDGSPLVNADADPHATLLYPPPRDTSPQPPAPPSYSQQPQNQFAAPPPPSWGPTPPPAPARKKSALPWIIGGLVVGAVFIVGAIVVLALIGSSMKKTTTDNGGVLSSNSGGLSNSSNSGTSSRSPANSDDLLGTKWSGPDNDDNKTRTYEFLSGGDVKMTGEDGTVYHGQWTQTGKTLHIDINGYTREGDIQGQRIEGTGIVQGRPFKWYAVKSSESASSSSSSSSSSTVNLLGTSWRGPDSDDHLNRTYDFLQGGDLKMTGQDGTVYHGTWTQSGSSLHIDINGYTREGTIVGNRINGSGVVQGRNFTWYATRQ
ncbi:MAG TPA: hypothetical protein VK619_03590 [Pyrinomonadaceae bacterium]|nr:hypothetical protein [Pyrinomonadaceae bacterium]